MHDHNQVQQVKAIESKGEGMPVNLLYSYTLGYLSTASSSAVRSKWDLLHTD